MMGTQNYEVLEISSDEEDQDWGRRGDWLEGLLLDDKQGSDEVVIVGEVSGSSNSVLKSNHNDDDDDDDDECLILDGDPDKPVEVSNDTGHGNESDELMVTGEKGQIACRDYPHPRHLCAKYSFTTNPHEKYCDLCHCYVCDTKAPCMYWGTGVSSGDHCHSSDKEEVWKIQRKWIKQGKPAALLATCLATMHPLVAPPVHKPAHAPSIPQPLSNGSTQPYIQPCSSQRNHQLPRVTAGRNSVAHPGVSTSTPWSSGSNIRSNIHKDRANGRFVLPHVNFKRVNRSGSGMCNNNQVYAYAMAQPQSNYPKGVAYTGIQNTRSQDHLVGNNSEQNVCQMTSQATVGVSFMDSQSHNILQTQAYSLPMPQPQAYHQPVAQPQAYYQPVPQPPSYSQQPQGYSQAMHQPSQNHINTYPLNQASNRVNQNLPGLEPHLLNSTVQSLNPSENSHITNVQPTPVPLSSSQQSTPLSSVLTQVTDVRSCSEPSPMIPSSSMQHTPGLTIQLSSVKPSPVTELPPRSDLGSEEFDLDSWIQSLEQHQDLLIPSSALMFDFENS